MNPPNQRRTHLLFLDSLRALAAVYVVMHHAALQYSIVNNLSGIKKAIIHIFQYGHYAVDLFIVLSGYSLMLSVTKNDNRLKGGVTSFLKRRVIRILPPYYFAMAFSIILIWLFVGTPTGTHWDYSLPVTTPGLITHIFLIHDFFASTAGRINQLFGQFQLNSEFIYSFHY